MKKVQLTTRQRAELEDLWFEFGNHGKKHSMANHKYIQALLERGEDLRGFYKPDPECLSAAETILESSLDKAHF
jgi:hypothetical protein